MRLCTSTPITAVVYTDGTSADLVMRSIADDLVARGYAVAGFLQINRPRVDRVRCDAILQEIASGAQVTISEDRGPNARGCMLDIRELARAEMLAAKALAASPDLLIINKFGKTESEGGGFRQLMVAAIEQTVPILISVPARNLDPWRIFSGDMSIDHPLATLSTDIDVLYQQLGFVDADKRRSNLPGTDANDSR